ncbi:MAG: hypothetical protein FXF47_02305 [Candidatus Mcinerneyibacterium aminivorans]|jgi:hypothetical protein|uniref:WD40-like Beta Propeller Repeat n=1 Tax=Candidatus Mcinerneyibacterium aminivorans TaxID=2703815 RepID=A0A5D0MJL1_9BACT|nr:MAG: hypothetical protein FXF47_02305 [Candidatus Mcinerneyibacterium aminivorans]
MKFKVFLMVILLIFVLFASVNAKGDSDTKLLDRKGMIIGENPPKDKPELFAKGIVSTGMFERDITFSPDYSQCYFRIQLGGRATIITLKQKNRKWTKPHVAEFSGIYNDMEPHISPDGKYLYFVSNRPMDDSKQPLDETNIWRMKKNGKKWGKPEPLGEKINGRGNVYYPSVTKNNQLYFTRRDENNNEYIFVSDYENGKFKNPVKLPDTINSGKYQFNAAISPDGDYIIVPVFGRKDSIGATDYYISFKKDDKWGKLKNLGSMINSEKSEYAPYITPDGKYLFFQSQQGSIKNMEKMSYEKLKKIFKNPRNGLSDIYWISTEFLYELK